VLYVQNEWCSQIRSGTFIVVLVLNYFQGHVVQEDDCLTLKRKAFHNPLKAVELLTQQCCITSQITGILNFTVITPRLFLNSSCTFSLPSAVVCAVTEHLPAL